MFSILSTSFRCLLLVGVFVGLSKAGADEPVQADKSREVLETLENSLGMRFIKISPGEFLMGSPRSEPNRFESEQQHKVKISKEYWVGEEEVTIAQYEKVMRIDSNNRPDGNIPNTMVNWYEAEEFCRNLSQLEDERAAGRIYRLPTEAEWEYACRAGTQTAFSWGDDPNLAGQYAWYYENREQSLRRAGSRKPNPWGLYDMHGSAWEWCSDWFADLPADEQLDPRGPASGQEKVIRGGAHNSPIGQLRSAMRVPYAPTFDKNPRGVNVGFRVVMVLDEEAPVLPAKK